MSIRDVIASSMANSSDMTNRIVQGAAVGLYGNIQMTNSIPDPKKKIILSSLSNYVSSDEILDIDPVKLKNISSASPETLIILTVIYYLSNLNTYDYRLINITSDLDMPIENMLVLLLLNDIDSIRTFCKQNELNQNITYRIITLKKLSALHKIENVF